MIRKIKFLILFVLIAFSSEVFSQTEQLVLQIRDVAEIGGEYIKVCDVASVLTSDLKLAKQIENMVIRKSPYPGKSLELRSVDVKACLMRNRIDAEDIDLRGSETVLVTSKSIQITSKQIIEQAENFVLHEMPWNPEDVRIEVISSPSDLIVHDGDLTFEVYPATKNYYVGQVVINVKVFIDGSLKKSIPVTMRVRIFDEVVVINKALNKEEVINESDLSIEKREVSNVKGGVFENISDVVGKVAKIRIKAQSILRDGMVQSPLMIKRNELVKVKLSLKNLEITSRAIARQDGREGDFIAVKNIDNTKKEFYGLVIGPGVVRVDL